MTVTQLLKGSALSALAALVHHAHLIADQAAQHRRERLEGIVDVEDLERVAGERTSVQHTVIPPELVVRGTTAPPPAT